MLRAGADVTLLDRHGNSVLHLATKQGDEKVLNVLLHHKEASLMKDLANSEGKKMSHGGFTELLINLFKVFSTSGRPYHGMVSFYQKVPVIAFSVDP